MYAKKVLTWRERCQRFDDGHITTNADIQRVMQEEIDELRACLTQVRARQESKPEAKAK